MNEQVELAPERLPHFGENPLHVLVGANVALGQQRARDRLGQLPHTLLDPLALISEGERGSACGQLLRDRPCDRAAVRDAENQTSLAGEVSHGGGESIVAPCGSLSSRGDRAGSARPWRACSPHVGGGVCSSRAAASSSSASRTRSAGRPSLVMSATGPRSKRLRLGLACGIQPSTSSSTTQA